MDSPIKVQFSRVEDMFRIDQVFNGPHHIKGNRVVQTVRKGIFCGSFLRGARYVEEKGYFPAPTVQPHVILRPGAWNKNERVRIVT